MAKVMIDIDNCQGCELCTVACPKDIVVMDEKLNKKGFYPAAVIDMDKCIGCAFCAVACPHCVIMVEK